MGSVLNANDKTIFRLKFCHFIIHFPFDSFFCSEKCTNFDFSEEHKILNNVVYILHLCCLLFTVCLFAAYCNHYVLSVPTVSVCLLMKFCEIYLSLLFGHGLWRKRMYSLRTLSISFRSLFSTTTTTYHQVSFWTFTLNEFDSFRWLGILIINKVPSQWHLIYYLLFILKIVFVQICANDIISSFSSVLKSYEP